MIDTFINREMYVILLRSGRDEKSILKKISAYAIMPIGKKM